MSFARDLTFEERVAAQEAIESVYYSHQIGATRPFEEAVPRAVLEQKVRTYLKQSAALEQFWKAPITASMLRAEVVRMFRQSQMPDRLRELITALNNDPFLIQECLARPALAARLVGNFLAFDDRIHSATRHLAESARNAPAAHKPLTVVEERDAFVVRERNPGHQTVDSGNGPPAVRRFPKIRMDTWWSGVEGGLSAGAVQAVGDDGFGDLPPIVRETSTQSCLTDNTWDNGSLDDFLYGRSYATAVWTGSFMVVWGGTSGDVRSIASNTGGRYDPATDTWLPTALQNAPSPRVSHTAVWTGSEMIIWGGDGPEAIFGGLDTGARYNPLTDTWVSTKASGAPSPRRWHTAIWTGSRMVVWGGYGWTGSGVADLNTGGQYDLSNDSWTPTSTTGAPPAGHNYRAVWTGTEMILWKGGTGGRYVPSSDTWGTLSTVNAPAGGPAFWTGDRMLVFSPDATTAGGRYDPGSDSWTPMSRNGAPELNRFSPTVVWTGGEIILWGGLSAGGDVNTGGRYSPTTDSWTITSTLNAPQPRSRHVAVWTGSLMVVWGGFDSGNYLDIATGGRYDPLTDSWTPTSESSAPSARYGHTAVWTGNSMIVWGGVDTTWSYIDTGGRYDPAMDNWAPTASSGAPSPRGGYTAVWTGDSMVVWGGGDGVTRFNDGARYDPVSDHWTPTSPLGAPTGRSGHTAVWTGNSMIVWGGTDGTIRFNSGANYDPVADSWSPTSLAGAPSPRSYHLAVWTGDQMIVWGGRAGSTLLNTGGRYNPATGTWAPTSTVNTPLLYQLATRAVWTGKLMLIWATPYGGGNRYDPVQDVWTASSPPPYDARTEGASVVWTGSRMIIWGGGAAPSGDFAWAINTGAIYDPIGDCWVLTSMENAASERFDHTAVWTGTTMIVWGGWGPADVTPFLNSGGRFIYGQSIDDDGDGFTECSGDCNDADRGVYPGAPQVCDDLNNDCTAPGWPSLAGTNEADNDGDTLSACQGDCNDTDAQVWLTPVEVANLGLAGSSPTNLAWDSQGTLVGPETSYDLVSGSLGSGVDFASGNCLPTVGGTTYTDTRANPGLGTGYWYLARGKNSCGVGTYGSSQRDSSIPSCP